MNAIKNLIDQREMLSEPNKDTATSRSVTHLTGPATTLHILTTQNIPRNKRNAKEGMSQSLQIFRHSSPVITNFGG